MIEDIVQERRKLVVDIFERTGDKMHPLDPAVTAALFYSSLVREAADEMRNAAASIEKQLQATVNEAVVRAVRREEEGLSARLKSRMDEALRAFGRASESSHSRQPLFADLRLAIFGLSALVLGAAAVGALYFPEVGLTDRQRLEIKLGRALLSSYNKLDKKTQAKLAQVLGQQ